MNTDYYEILKGALTIFINDNNQDECYPKLLKLIDFLINDKKVDITKNNNEIFINTVKYGPITSIEWLLNNPEVNPADQDNKALCMISEKAQNFNDKRSTKILYLLLNNDKVLSDKSFVKCINEKIIKQIIDSNKYDLLYKLFEHNEYCIMFLKN